MEKGGTFITPCYNDKIEKYIKDLENIAGSKNLLQKEIGFKLARAFKKRYDTIKSFTNFAEFVTGHIDNTELLVGDLHGYYSMTLDANYRIIVSPETKDLSIEILRQINTFKVIGVIDYHGKGRKDNKWLIK